MEYLTSLCTDIGIKKDTNQDSALMKVAKTKNGKIAFCVICDGMGGLSKGELASATIVNEFNKWFCEKLPRRMMNEINEYEIKKDWEDIVNYSNKKIKRFGHENRVNLGTTLAAILLVNNRALMLNVGDTRIYKIDKDIKCCTKDQTLIEREIEKGLLTEEQGKVDPRRSVLLQCIGASNVVIPDFYAHDACPNEIYLLCSDGFRHEISEKEILEKCKVDILVSKAIMYKNSKELIEINKQRGETDNITVALVRTY